MRVYTPRSILQASSNNNTTVVVLVLFFVRFFVRRDFNRRSRGGRPGPVRFFLLSTVVERLFPSSGRSQHRHDAAKRHITHVKSMLLL